MPPDNPDHQSSGTPIDMHKHPSDCASSSPQAPAGEKKAALVDTTIPARIANQAHGIRYGKDWVWHDDVAGIIPEARALALMDEEARQ